MFVEDSLLGNKMNKILAILSGWHTQKWGEKNETK